MMPMSNAIRPRRATVATLILTALIVAFPAARASAVTGEVSYNYTPRKICSIDWRAGRREVKHLIRCAANHWGVNPDKALTIAHRESLFEPDAYNSWSCAKGIYQHLCRYWPERAYDYGFKGKSAYNARANIIVTMKMVRRLGWSPWGG
jgi:soluble lytic murein transglycosylase-like protein